MKCFSKWCTCTIFRPSEISWCVDKCIIEDDDDIQRQSEITILCSKQTQRHFWSVLSCSKNTLFRAYCMPMYACQLWSKYTQTSMKRLRVAYNNACRIMHYIPRNRGGARHFHLGGPLEGPVLQQGELSMVCVGLSERDLKNFGGAVAPLGTHLAPTLPRNVSVRPHQVSHCVRTFDAVLRNNLYRFFMRCTSSSNFFIRSLQMSDTFYKSSFFLNYSTLLYGDQMQ